MKANGVNEVNPATLLDWFSRRPYIHCTGADVKKVAAQVGIEIKPCRTMIPVEFMPVHFLEKEINISCNVFTEKEIYDLYYVQNLKVAEIIKIKKCSASSFYVSLKKFGFSVKYKSENKGKKGKATHYIKKISIGG